MSRENALWGAPRIAAELAVLGHEVAGIVEDSYRQVAPKTLVKLLDESSG